MGYLSYPTAMHIYLVVLYQCKTSISLNMLIFTPTGFLARVSYCHHWASVVCRPSFNFSHFNQLLWSHWANLNQTLVEWSLDGPLPNLCPVIPTSNQDGHQAKNRKRGDEIFLKSPLKLLSQSQPNFAEMILGWSPSKFMSGISDLRSRWPPQPNLI